MSVVQFWESLAGVVSSLGRNLDSCDKRLDAWEEQPKIAAGTLGGLAILALTVSTLSLLLIIQPRPLYAKLLAGATGIGALGYTAVALQQGYQKQKNCQIAWGSLALVCLLISCVAGGALKNNVALRTCGVLLLLPSTTCWLVEILALGCLGCCSLGAKEEKRERNQAIWEKMHQQKEQNTNASPS